VDTGQCLGNASDQMLAHVNGISDGFTPLAIDVVCEVESFTNKGIHP
jgi:hypothetical protein